MSRKTLAYPGVLAPIRLAAFVPLIIGTLANNFTISAFGIGWWLACLVCEFAYSYICGHSR